MTPTEFRAHLHTLGWTPWALAGRLGVNPSTPRRWASGELAIPENVAAWVERLAEGIEADALPEGWEIRRAAAAFVERATATAEAANATLVRIGTHTEDGKLTDEYR